ncbi:MAG: hypothetical protein GWN18_03135 [Thermoplasmata archaeon]|nr:hypothetical protein [Thermoplasmata archaeon]NIS11019.1 hypothetical protein [Thermoplasmata archaeon]NIS18951.1 hypothetical protein [Thermoplasmata archaeon]NIT76000.1 hypothetical protein [Thermoplasmata archaeon]NIU48101.1 hypothetical protein [Thermoplasmata archaeon]
MADTVMDLVDANSEVTVSFKVELEDGNNTMRVSAFSLRQVEERSLSNNEAERSFDIPPPDVTGDNWLLLQFVLGAIVLVVALILVAFWVYAVVMSRKD